MARGKNRNKWRGRKAFQRVTFVVRTLTGEMVFRGEYRLTNNGEAETREALQFTIGRGRKGAERGGYFRTNAGRGLRRFKRRQLESMAEKAGALLEALNVPGGVEIFETDRAETGDASGASYQACLRFVLHDCTTFQRDAFTTIWHNNGGAVDVELLSCGRSVRGKVNSDEAMPIGKRVCYSTKKGGAKRTTPVYEMDREHIDRRDSGLCGDRPDVTRDLRPIPAPATH